MLTNIGNGPQSGPPLYSKAEGRFAALHFIMGRRAAKRPISFQCGQRPQSGSALCRETKIRYLVSIRNLASLPKYLILSHSCKPLVTGSSNLQWAVCCLGKNIKCRIEMFSSSGRWRIHPNSIELGIQVVFNGSTWVYIGLGLDRFNPIGYQLGFSWYYLGKISWVFEVWFPHGKRSASTNYNFSKLSYI